MKPMKRPQRSSYHSPAVCATPSSIHPRLDRAYGLSPSRLRAADNLTLLGMQYAERRPWLTSSHKRQPPNPTLRYGFHCWSFVHGKSSLHSAYRTLESQSETQPSSFRRRERISYSLRWMQPRRNCIASRGPVCSLPPRGSDCTHHPRPRHKLEDPALVPIRSCWIARDPRSLSVALGGSIREIPPLLFSF